MNEKDVLSLDFDGWPLPSEYLEELGRLAAFWSSLESQLDLSLGKLAGFDTTGDARAFILLKHSSFPQKLDSLSALCVLLLPQFPVLEAYADTVSRLKSAQSLRNRFLHNGMSLNPETGKVEMAVGSARGKLKTSVESVSVADIRRAGMEVHRAMLALHKLVTGKEYPPRWEQGDT